MGYFQWYICYDINFSKKLFHLTFINYIVGVPDFQWCCRTRRSFHLPCVCPLVDLFVDMCFFLCYYQMLLERAVDGNSWNFAKMCVELYTSCTYIQTYIRNCHIRIYSMYTKMGRKTILLFIHSKLKFIMFYAYPENIA